MRDSLKIGMGQPVRAGQIDLRSSLRLMPSNLTMRMSAVHQNSLKLMVGGPSNDMSDSFAQHLKDEQSESSSSSENSGNEDNILFKPTKKERGMI